MKEQTLELGPVVLELYRAILSDPEGPTAGKVPEDLAVRFSALLTPSMQDQVNNYAQTAGADVGYATAGILKPEQIALARSKQKGGLFPAIDTKALEANLSLDNDLDVLSDPLDPNGAKAAAEGAPAGSQAQPEGLETKPGDEPQKAALNGGQVTALQGITIAAASGELPKTTAIELVLTAFPVSREQANAIFADIPDGKFDEKEAAPDPINPLLGLGAPEDVDPEAPKAPPVGKVAPPELDVK